MLGERSVYRLVGLFERQRREEMTRVALEMDWTAYLKVRVGDISTSLLLTIQQLSYGIQTFVRAVGTLGVAAMFAIAAVAVSLKLGLIALGLAALALVVYLVGVKPTQRHLARLTDAASLLGRESDLVFANLKLFRSQGGRNFSRERMERIYAEYSDAYVKSQYVVPFTRSLLEFIGIAGVGIVILGALLTTPGALLSASSLAFLVLFLRLAPRLTLSQELFQQARIYRKWCDSWWEMIDTAVTAPMSTGGTVRASFQKGLEFHDVGFVYPGTSRPILNGITWEIHPGEAVAFVGDSGAGKTTIVDLVTGLIRPSEGLVLLDGRDLREVNIEEWQSHLGLVMQEPPLLAGSVFDNICWTEPLRDLEKAKHALDMANASEFVDRLPEGISTVIGQRGATLSGGEKQRLALARALYREPWLLILDEPTAALDAGAEEEVVRALEGIKATCAMIVIAHGLNPVRLAERIYVLEGGAISECGSWNDLASRPDGRFARMVEMRLRPP
ncbi:MAG: ATP-binding cassette domain-containing protein [Acidimicrobiales bacterium]